MKFPSIALTFLLAAAPAFAERAALIKHDDEWNLFSKFELSSSSIEDNDATLGGLTVGGMLNDRIGIGVTAQVLIESVETDSELIGDIEEADFYYGGGYLEYIVTSPDNLVYLSLDVIIGLGRIETKSGGVISEKETFFMVEPGLNLMINVTETFNIGIGVSRRFADDVDLPGLEPEAAEDTTATLFLRFTQF